MEQKQTILDRVCETARNLSKTRRVAVWVTQTGPDQFQIETLAVPKGIVIAKYENGTGARPA